jgi:hypothetical protein
MSSCAGLAAADGDRLLLAGLNWEAQDELAPFTGLEHLISVSYDFTIVSHSVRSQERVAAADRRRTM